jgi:Cu/Ag efflux pump CusA
VFGIHFYQNGFFMAIKDEVHELEERLQAIEIEKAIQEGIQRRVRTICITATSALLTAMFATGKFIYNEFNAVSAGVLAFYHAMGGT